MALTAASTIADALDQYKANLAYWESAAKAAALYEAVLYLLACKPEMLAAADQNVKFTSLDSLRVRLESQVLGSSSAANRATFTRGRMRMS
jgi:hypothetical protein